MAPEEKRLDDTDGELLIRTGTTGPAARLGHRLTLLMGSWQAVVTVEGGRPVAVTLRADVDSLEIRRGDGGATPMSAPERKVARSNALKDLDAKRHPTITFHAAAVVAVDGGYRLDGSLDIHGVRREHGVTVTTVEDADRRVLSATSSVRQSDHGVTPHSVLLGAVRVDDVVTIEWSATEFTTTRP